MLPISRTVSRLNFILRAEFLWERRFHPAFSLAEFDPMAPKTLAPMKIIIRQGRSQEFTTGSKRWKSPSDRAQWWFVGKAAKLETHGIAIMC